MFPGPWLVSLFHDTTTRGEFTNGLIVVLCLNSAQRSLLLSAVGTLTSQLCISNKLQFHVNDQRLICRAFRSLGQDQPVLALLLVR